MWDPDIGNIPWMRLCNYGGCEILHQLKRVINIPWFEGFQPSFCWCRISFIHSTKQCWFYVDLIWKLRWLYFLQAFDMGKMDMNIVHWWMVDMAICRYTNWRFRLLPESPGSLWQIFSCSFHERTRTSP